MRNRRQLALIFLGAALFVLLLMGGSRGNRALLLAGDAEEAAYLPVVLAQLLEATATATLPATPSATATETVAATATETETPAASATATATSTATETMAPTATETIMPTPTETAVSITPTATATSVPGPHSFYLPIIGGRPFPVLDVPVAVSKEPPIDFEAERAMAWENGHDLAFNKVGFHILQFGSREGLQEYIESLDSAGVPAVLKSANDAEYIYEAQKLAKVSGVEHVLIYRDATHGRDIPNYDLDPITAARLNWAENRRVFPPELDPALVWMETTNEPDRTKSTWLAEFALEQAKTAVREGARFAAFGWAGGEPERVHWQSPEMLEFLRYAAQHPQQIAVALHEYSFVEEDIGNDYPDLIGRMQTLFDVADENGIPRPTVLVTEWGWEYNEAPSAAKAMFDINWASWFYAAYPQVKGVAIWTLGRGGGEFGSIGDDVQKYLAPVTDYSLGNYFLYSPGTRPIDEQALAPPSPPGTLTPSPTPTATIDPAITPTPTITPTPDPVNLLRNGSFEDDWETIPIIKNQRPFFWELSWVEEGEPLYDSTDVANGACECVHKLKDQLPPEQQPGGADALILDGVVTYKMFNASRSFGSQLSQTVGGLTAGSEYILSVPLRVHFDKDKEDDAFGAEAGVWVEDVGDWSNLEDMGDRTWCKHELTFTAPADGSVDIDVRVKSKYDLPKDFFMDDFRLVAAGEAPPHPQYPLCDPSPEPQHYRPFRRLSWLGR